MVLRNFSREKNSGSAFYVLIAVDCRQKNDNNISTPKIDKIMKKLHIKIY